MASDRLALLFFYHLARSKIKVCRSFRFDNSWPRRYRGPQSSDGSSSELVGSSQKEQQMHSFPIVDVHMHVLPHMLLLIG
jgi:hypothetical protein